MRALTAMSNSSKYLQHEHPTTVNNKISQQFQLSSRFLAWVFFWLKSLSILEQTQSIEKDCQPLAMPPGFFSNSLGLLTFNLRYITSVPGSTLTFSMTGDPFRSFNYLAND